MQRVNRGLIVSGGLVLLMIGVLAVMGREWICTCGSIKLWHGAVFSSENSQHISDWYTPSHLIHGFLFYGLGWLVLRRQHWGWKLALATLIEITWEIVENTDAVKRSLPQRQPPVRSAISPLLLDQTFAENYTKARW